MGRLDYQVEQASMETPAILSEFRSMQIKTRLRYVAKQKYFWLRTLGAVLPEDVRQVDVA